MADNKLLELLDVLNEQLKKDHLTEADEKELDGIIKCLNGSEIAMKVAEVAKIAMRSAREARAALRWANESNTTDVIKDRNWYHGLSMGNIQSVFEKSNKLPSLVNKITNVNSIADNNKYLLKKTIDKAIENIAKSKEYVRNIQIGNEHENTIGEIASNLKKAEDILKGKVEELNKQFTDKRSQKEKISESATQVYNSYLLLYKLNELKVDGGKSLQEVISEAIDSGKEEVSITVNEKEYKVEITKKDDSYKLKVLGEHDNQNIPAKPEVKDVLSYTDEEIIDLWANSEVSIEKDQSNNFAFAVGLHDKSRLLDLKVGGLGKKVPFNLRFANFYKVIEILKDEETPLEERFRLANNIATGSGKTGDIALLKFWAYLASIPCITMVPNDTLRNQSNKFDKEFLPGEVAMEFGELLSEGNTRYATTTFDEAFNTQWDLLKGIYGENSKELALFLIDEAPKLKENAVLLARAIAIALHNPTAFFSATPDAFLSEEFGIICQILLSPKERAELGTGKLPVVHYHKMKFKTSHEMENAISSINQYDLRLVDPAKAYTERIENTHEKLNEYKDAVEKFKTAVKSHGKHPDLSQLSQPFLDFINQSLDSQAYKEGLIATEERWAREVTDAIIDNKKNGQGRKKKRTESFVKAIVEAIKGLDTGLDKNDVTYLVEQNLNVEVGGQLLPYIKLHNIIDTLNEYKKSGKAVEVSQFIKDKYGIIDSDNLKFNSELSRVILRLEKHQGYPEYASSIKRNYPGDKKLYEHIFQQFSDIKEFCEQDAVVHYFNGRVKRFKSNREEICQYISDSDRKNILNMIKAGFVPNVLSKELAIGIDAPRLSRVAAIIKDKTEMLDPMFLLQLMGRVGRDVKRKGLCYFDMFTSDGSDLKIDDIIILLGEKLLERLEEGYKKYIKDEEGITQAESEMLDYDLRINHIVHYACNTRFLPEHKSIFDMMQSHIKNEFNKINTQYSYDKEICLRIFIQILKSTNAKLKLPLNYDQGSPSQIHFFHNFILDHNKIQELKTLVEAIDNTIKLLESKQTEGNTVQYSDDMSLEDWARYIVHVEPTSLENLVKADPNSNAPIFVKQKQISQNQDASVHNVGQSVNPSRTTPATIQNKPIHQVSEPFMTGPTVPLEDPSTTNESPQRTSAKKKVMYGFMIAFPPLAAVGIYSGLVGTAAFDPVIATGIFIGVAVIALALFVTVKKVCDKQSGSGMDTPPSKANLSSLSSLNLPKERNIQEISAI